MNTFWDFFGFKTLAREVSWDCGTKANSFGFRVQSRFMLPVRVSSSALFWRVVPAYLIMTFRTSWRVIMARRAVAWRAPALLRLTTANQDHRLSSLRRLLLTKTWPWRQTRIHIWVRYRWCLSQMRHLLLVLHIWEEVRQQRGHHCWCASNRQLNLVIQEGYFCLILCRTNTAFAHCCR